MVPGENDTPNFISRSKTQFRLASYILRHAELAPHSELASEKHIPEYLLLGDQSAGKTVILSRLARRPLGFSCGQTGTRRPFQYTLIHDPAVHECNIKVDGVPVDESNLLEVLTRKNGAHGFDSSAVFVEIHSSKVNSLIITDLPGMKDGEDKPELMALERLKKPNMIPVVILEPKDLSSAHYVYKVIEKADPPRARSDIVALVNKVDEKLANHGEWSTPSGWQDQWQSVKHVGFKAIFFVGWPNCSDRNTSDGTLKKRLLAESYQNEADMISKWFSEVASELTPEVEAHFGLENFSNYLHQDQSRRLDEFLQEVGPKIKNALDGAIEERRKLEEVNQNTCEREVIELVDAWTAAGKDVLDGNYDPLESKYQTCKSNLQEDLQCLDAGELKDLHGFDEYGQAAEELIAHHPNNAVLRVVPHAHLELLGKAAHERDASLMYIWAWGILGWTVNKDFTQEFIANVHAVSDEDTGNKVISQFKKRLLKSVFHPLADVHSLMVRRHTRLSMLSVLADLETGTVNRKWLSDYLRYRDTCLAADFKRKMTNIVFSQIKDMNEQLHKTLQMQEYSFQSISRSTEVGMVLASNVSGVAGKASAPLFHDGEDQCQHLRHFFALSSKVLSRGGDKGKSLALFAEFVHSQLGGERLPALISSNSSPSISSITSAVGQPELATFAGEHELQEFFTAEAGHWQWMDERVGLFHCKHTGFLALPEGTTPHARDEPHEQSILRSRLFMITEQTEIRVKLVGGTGCKTSIASEVACVSGRTFEGGFLGIALRNSESNVWVLSKRKRKCGLMAETLVFSSSDLQAYRGKAVTLDVVDTFHGYWGFLALVAIEISESSLLRAVQDCIEIPALPGTPSRSLPAVADAALPSTGATSIGSDAVEVAASAKSLDAKGLGILAAHHVQELYKHSEAPNVEQIFRINHFAVDYQKLYHQAVHEVLEQLNHFKDTCAHHVKHMRFTLLDKVTAEIHSYFHSQIPGYTSARLRNQRHLIQRAVECEQNLQMAKALWHELAYDVH